MDVSFEIRTGDLECPYTQEATDVLIKATNGDISTGWLSVPVLERCLKFLRACTDLEKDEEEEDRGDIQREILGELQLIRSELPALAGMLSKGFRQPVERQALPSPSVPPPPDEGAEVPRPRPSRVATGPSARDRAAMKQFAEEIAELVNNPPTDDNPMAKSSGLSEAHIRETIHKWKTVFEDKNVMYLVVQKAFGMTRERFETILKVKT